MEYTRREWNSIQFIEILKQESWLIIKPKQKPASVQLVIYNLILKDGEMITSVLIAIKEKPNVHSILQGLVF